MPNCDYDSCEVVLEKTDAAEQNQHPDTYDVIMFNDDVTPMDLVVYILIECFEKTPQEAVQIMLDIHHSDKGLIGTYPMEEAYSRVEKSNAVMHDVGIETLMITVEEH